MLLLFVIHLYHSHQAENKPMGCSTLFSSHFSYKSHDQSLPCAYTWLMPRHIIPIRQCMILCRLNNKCQFHCETISISSYLYTLLRHVYIQLEAVAFAGIYRTAHG